MSLEKDFCSDIAIIPQFDLTCWFNAILMSCFYSQRMRNLMIHKVSKTWDNTSLFKLFKTIIKNNYNIDAKTKLENLYDKIKPELILLKTLAKFNPDLFLYFKIKQNTDFRWNNNYIINFLGFLNVNYLDIIYFNDDIEDEDVILFNFFKYYKPQIIKNQHTGEIFDINFSLTIDDKTVFTKAHNEIKEIIKNIPDVLILRHEHFIQNVDINEVFTNLTTIFKDVDFHKSNHYHINKKSINDIKLFKDVIHIFDNIYELDNVILSNFNNNDNDGHTILGMYCNNSKYIYNGWNNPLTNKPHPLYKFNWNIHQYNPFSLNHLQYSFNKGDAVLIYVRKYDFSSSSLSLTSSFNSLSNIHNILRDYYDLNDLNLTKIKFILKKLFVDFNDTDDYDILEELLFSKLEQFYYYKDLTKAKLIHEIKILKPDITNLNLLKKKELEKIFKSLIDKSLRVKKFNTPIKKIKKYINK